MLKRPLALRTRLALGYTAFFGLVLMLMGIGMALAVRSTLLAEIERELSSSSELIQKDFDSSNIELADYFNNPAFLQRTRPLSVEGLKAPSLYVQVSNQSGQVVVTSASLQRQVLPLPENLRAEALGGHAHVWETALGDAPMLMMVSPLWEDQRIVGVLQVAQPLREINRTLQLLTLSLGAIGLIALLASLRGGAWLAARALLPVGQVAHTTRQIVRAEDLAQRVPAAPGDDEIAQLTATINEMLERLETLFTSQRRFVADVSHELRTPLAAMRGNLEILRRGAARDPHELDMSLAAMEREVNRLVRLASDLLLLAQAEVGMQLRRGPVALDELVLEVIRDLAPLAQAVTLLPEVDEQVEVIGDRDRLKQALLNMVVNAIQHTPPGGKVGIGLACAGGRALLSVSDTGVGIATDDLPRVFERFFRADKSRSRAAGGAGLGLAIVKWVAEVHGGGVQASSVAGQGSRFQLWLPLPTGDAPADLAIVRADMGINAP
ncbi:MAG TPA: ATP-binding protein [Kouleothrix sp.]|uniref:sensor histidine kinase n=1 Tax=Kouleothrix sp. TaxID=2779161 RepID=UPI002B870953|nr:ATP-binding protein [Kouleothrix sp.]HRC74555.1 ATP-binding protein [Kouleothrix sp.]